MKKLGLSLAAVLLFAVATDAQYHPEVFVIGGLQNTGQKVKATGLWLMDGHQRTVTRLFPTNVFHGPVESVVMDYDNRCLICVVRWYTTTLTPFLQDGIFRFDPATRQFTTIYRGHYGQTGPGWWLKRVMLNQDGDYVFGSINLHSTSPTTIKTYDVLRYNPTTSGVTTIMSPLRDLGDYSRIDGAFGHNISTGNYLVQAHSLSPTTLYDWNKAVLEVDATVDGKWTTFSNGGGYYLPGTTTHGYGWLQYGGPLCQDYATDAIVTLDEHGWELRLEPGRKPRTTLSRINNPSLWTIGRACHGIPDLQSAATPRYVRSARYKQGINQTVGYYIYYPHNYARTAVAVDPNNTIGYRNGPTGDLSHFLPYRSRHIASRKVGNNTWDLLFSAPNHPNKAYVAALGISGIRPAVVLKDGRKIWLKLDPVAALSMQGALHPFFAPGPLRLDAKGEARGRLDLSGLPKLGGRPVWIALLVLDPLAPGGIGLIPDTHVIRVP